MSDSLILIGRIGSPWGIQGFNWVQLFTAEPETAFSYRPWVLRRPHPVKKGQYLAEDFEVKRPKGKAQAKGWVCKLDPEANRNEAEVYKGLEIWVDAQNLPELSDGEVYHHQLIGLTVVNEQDQNLGQVASVMETGSNDVLVVRAGTNSLDDQERLIPWLDDVVKGIHLDQQQIQVDWPADW